MDLTKFLGRAWRNRIFDAWRMRDRRLSVSPEEKKLIDLLSEHQEFARYWRDPKRYLDYQFDPDFDEVDPFFHILIHEVVDEQITNDEPSGVRVVYGRLTEHNLDTHDVIHRMGAVFLKFLYPVLQGRGEFDSSAYIEELHIMASDPNYFEQYGEEQGAGEAFLEDEEALPLPDVDQIMAEFKRLRRKEQDEMPILINTRLRAALNKCPAMWVEAMGAQLGRPSFRRNRERTADLSQYLADPKNLRKVVRDLSDKGREALTSVVKNGGWIKYGQLAKLFGDEEQDGWWWLEEPPTSTIGQLRLSGLLYVGRAPIGTRRYKVAVVPKELREGLAAALNIVLPKS